METTSCEVGLSIPSNLVCCSYSFARAALTKYRKQGDLEQQKPIASVLEAGSPVSRGQCASFLEGKLCSTPLPQLLVVLAVDDVPCRNITPSLPSPSCGVPVYMSVSKFPLFIQTPYWIRAPPYLFLYVPCLN